MKDVMIRPERCLSCRSCEVACAVAHSDSKNLFSAIGENPIPKKRISLMYIPDLGISLPITCRHCEDAPCASVCPTKALHQDETASTVSYNPDRCVDCWTCSAVCPRFISLYHLILVMGCWTSSMTHNRGIISRQAEAGIKCDLCEGRDLPACVEACPTHALIFSEMEET
ncbi:MAG: 4Fe-4S dicluster domain-containing protein [Methanosarcina sp.]|jgi:carbon-monoxide dehydrogenase iron sulfur subunit|nr:4Fe-4S dicluster domain-containing protein [Methanosarcina sp.]MDD3872675.1 4Fe-4S dicluster domain-containing protein [Methanosarcina sp.]MDD4521893.1 4Fe-4S dicluster domain-containing protein [Methanosarcina sp.]HHV23169.1 4Fe-4S dicluster domain-containing protein [Methanosarcina sp.]